MQSHKRKKLLMLTDGNFDHPSSRIRGVQYIPLLEKEGYKVLWLPRVPSRKKGIHKFIFPIQKRINILLRIWYVVFYRFEIVYNQRLFLNKFLIKILKRKKTRILFDFDDAIYISSKKNAKIKTDRMIITADKVIVSNEILFQYSTKLNKSTEIITTPIDTDRIFPVLKKEEGKTLNIGWIGSFWTTQYLQEIEKPLREISKTIKIKLILVGADKNYQPEGIDFQHLDWSLDKENEYLQNFDIGVMPLTDDEFSAAKGGYKILQYMAVGIPTIASPVGINKKIIIEEQTGYLAKNSNEWIKYILELANNKVKRFTFGKQARLVAVEKYSREICFEKVLICF